MILRGWAEEFGRGHPLRAETRRKIDLHVADTATAFFAGCNTREGIALARFFAGGQTTLLARRAAAIAAIVRHTECDDIHMASCVTAGSAVIAVALAFCASSEAGSQRFDRAIVAGYSTGIRLGLALGGTAALSGGIWPSYFAAPLMAAATASVCLGLGPEATTSALAIAAAGAGGRVGRAPAAPSGRWLAFGEAVAKGCHAAEAAAAGFHGDANLVSSDWLAALADKAAIRPDALLAGDAEDLIHAVGFKSFVAARQTINAIHAFQLILEREGLAAKAIEHIEVGVPTINAAMVARPVAAGDRLGTISSMSIQIAAAAIRPDLLYDVERQGVPDAEMTTFARRVDVSAEPALDQMLPDMWAGRVRITIDGRELVETCKVTPGDHGDSAEPVIRQKLARMVPARYRDVCAGQMEANGDAARAIQRIALWQAIRDALAR
jgi:2-methylcitrate dehydratase PrpD